MPNEVLGIWRIRLKIVFVGLPVLEIHNAIHVCHLVPQRKNISQELLGHPDCLVVTTTLMDAYYINPLPALWKAIGTRPKWLIIKCSAQFVNIAW